MMAFCCCLLRLSKLFFDISTGSHMNTANCCLAREAVGDFVKPHRLEGPRLVSVAFAATLCRERTIHSAVWSVPNDNSITPTSASILGSFGVSRYAEAVGGSPRPRTCPHSGGAMGGPTVGRPGC